MSDNDLGALAIRLTASCVLFLIAIVGGCTMYEDNLVTTLILTGTAPADARCSVRGYGCK